MRRARWLLLACALAGPASLWAQPEPEPEAESEPEAEAAPSPTATPLASPKPTPEAPLPRPVKLPPPVQIRPEAALPVAPVPSGLEEMMERLETRASYLRKGDKQAADVELGHLMEVRRSLGNVNVPLASSVLLHESRRALEKGDAKLARTAAESAALLSPDMIPAHWARFHASLSEGDVAGALGAMVEAMSARFRGFRNQVATLTDLLGVFVLTVLGVTLLYTILQIARYARSATHDISEKLPAWAGYPVAAALLVLLLLSPLVVGVGLATAVAIWLAATMLYQSKRERAVSAALMVLLASIPLVLDVAAPLLLVHGSPVDDLATLASEAFAPDAEARLTSNAGAKTDYETAFLLARRAWAIGDLPAAERWYRAALVARPNDVGARNNLGMVLYQERQFDAALAEWKAAGRTRIEPVLNAAAIDLDKGRFDDAKAAFDFAAKMDPVRTRQFSETDASTTERLLAVPFDQSLLWKRLAARSEADREAVVAGVWARLGGFVPWHVFPLIALALAGLAWLLATKVGPAFSVPCPKCAQPADRRSKNGYCAQCNTIFLKAVAVEPAMRLQKEDAIRRRQTFVRWMERVLAVLAGAVQVIAGRPIEGALLLGGFTLVVAHFWWMEKLSVHPWATGLGLGAWHAGAALLICGILAFVSFRRAS